VILSQIDFLGNSVFCEESLINLQIDICNDDSVIIADWILEFVVIYAKYFINLLPNLQ